MRESKSTRPWLHPAFFHAISFPHVQPRATHVHRSMRSSSATLTPEMSVVTVPALGLGMRPRGPSTRPSLATLGIMSGVAISLSNSRKPPLMRSIRSSPPATSAPAACASLTFSPWVLTRGWGPHKSSPQVKSQVKSPGSRRRRGAPCRCRGAATRWLAAAGR